MLVGVLSLGLGVFTGAYYFNFIHNVTDLTLNGACYFIGGFILVVAGVRLIWKSISTLFHSKKCLSVSQKI
jgi:hypothetical protein